MKELMAILLSSFVMGAFAFCGMLIMGVDMSGDNFWYMFFGILFILLGKDISDYVYEEVMK